jgi:uncharacterized protein
MLRIPISRLGPQGLKVDEQVEATVLPLLKAAIADDASLDLTGPVQVHLHLRTAGEAIKIDGSVATQATVVCQRCLEPFALAITAAVQVTAVPETAADGDRVDSEVELLADEMDLITYSGDMVDLRDEVAQQIIMALPFSPLCKKSCQGLCHRCGANLNETACRCDPDESKSPFAALRSLSFPKSPD